ncbi:gluconate permease [Rhodococcoides fascians A25f]|uniref:GntP family permease n=1 Tax=Rhodococcoides fascians TaxID=1828 RepID=UPI00056011CE|nr:SLC13 family permease [Rhodococcus fascians]QII07289.1 gluconate permease [Rhodococcus fascians A25f]
MSNTWIVINTAIAVLAVVVLIMRLKFNPVISLVVGAAYLGLVTGAGVRTTVDTITAGFGEIMAEVGLLVAFGVLTGAILHEMGAIGRLVDALLKVFGPKRVPMAFSLTLATALQSIFLDVLVVISAPLARSIGTRIGKAGTARMATALAIGGECGIVLMVPGVGTIALAGLLGVPLGKMLLFGLVVIVPTVAIAVSIMSFLFQRGWWSEADEEAVRIDVESAHDTGRSDPEHHGDAGATTTSRRAQDPTMPQDDAPSRVDRSSTVVASPPTERPVPLAMLFAPLMLSLVLIGLGAIFGIADVEIGIVEFISEPAIALLIGLVGTSLLARRTIGRDRVEKAVGRGFAESGQILLLTGVGGSLAAVIKLAGLGEILGQYFSANTVAPVLLVWVIAALLHIAVGSVTISAITSAGILAPVAPMIGLDPVFLALAAGAGSLFAIHVTSNTFWLLKSLMGQTTRGTLKTCTVGVSVASVVALCIITPLSLVL